MEFDKPIAHIRESMFWNVVKGFGLGITVMGNFYNLDESVTINQSNNDILMTAAGYGLKAGRMIGDAVTGMAVMDAVASIDDHVYGYDVDQIEYDDPTIS